MRRLALTLAAMSVLLPVAARADHPFILPSNTSFSGMGNTVTLDAAGSDHVFFFDHRPLAPDTLSVEKPDGSAATIQPVRTRFRTVVDLPLDQAGTWKASSSQTMVTGSFMLDGVQRRVGGRPGGPPAGTAPMPPAPVAPGGEQRLPPVAVQDIPAAATDVHLVEVASLAQTFVTVDAPTTAAMKTTGHGLELDPITHPNTLVAGEAARFRFLIDGRPAAGIAVTVLPGGDRYRERDRAVMLKTGADGTVTVSWPGAGMYWLGAAAEDAHPAATRAETRRMAYSATLEVAAP